MNAIIYCRVSTTEQAKHGFSLEGQERECRQFALNSGYEVDKVFVERGESAKTQDRTELIKLIKYAVENKKRLTAFVIWKLDRLARNLSDQIELVKQFSSLGIRVLSATENNEENPVGRLMRNIIGSFAQYENDKNSERTVNGMRQAILQGRWCWQPPIGYKKSVGEDGKYLIVPAEDSVYVVESFQLFETSLYKQVQIAERLKEKGFKRATKGLINRILTNPLYCGIIRHKWFPAQDIPAIHKPIISKETFAKVQLILQGKKPIITPHVRNNPNFPLRNFVKCAKCGQKLTGGLSTGRKKVRYPYYHCRTKGCSLNVRKAVLEGKFYDLLQRLQPKKELVELFKTIVLDVWEAKQAEAIKEEYRIERELKELQGNKGRVLELLMDKTIDQETYREKAEELRNEIMVKSLELNEAKIDTNDAEACVNFCGVFLTNTAKLWANGELDLKQRFQRLIFPEAISFDGQEFGTAPISIIFEYLREENIKKLKKTSPRGFEPLPRA